MLSGYYHYNKSYLFTTFLVRLAICIMVPLSPSLIMMKIASMIELVLRGGKGVDPRYRLDTLKPVVPSLSHINHERTGSEVTKKSFFIAIIFNVVRFPSMRNFEQLDHGQLLLHFIQFIITPFTSYFYLSRNSCVHPLSVTLWSNLTLPPTLFFIDKCRCHCLTICISSFSTAKFPT